ncbi:hypothetical protein QWZ03_15370 [Chitinimonas viridis]|uniref:Uncharacterized protein n=1 Tax=Chitinimonas viridis TaxID=664880 RepID=A0ABT8B968_9NEIS|nr:hypothetical protein [Chitinimonas viridis]MDN3578146.1 hypothetical protein [Chitinimonas viridis]
MPSPPASAIFTHPEAWCGGSLDLLMYWPANTIVFAEVQGIIWRWPRLTGPYTRNDIEPDQQAVSTATEPLARFGVAQLPAADTRIAFSTYTVNDEAGSWVYAGLPIGSLGQVYPVGAYPDNTDPGMIAWESEVHAWLTDLANHVFAYAPFERGAIGPMSAYEVDELSRKFIPSRRWHTYLLAQHGTLAVYPPNRD